jgi:hypothetical protein
MSGSGVFWLDEIARNCKNASEQRVTAQGLIFASDPML